MPALLWLWITAPLPTPAITVRQTDKQTNKQTNKQTDKQTNRQMSCKGCHAILTLIVDNSTVTHPCNQSHSNHPYHLALPQFFYSTQVFSTKEFGLVTFLGALCIIQWQGLCANSFCQEAVNEFIDSQPAPEPIPHIWWLMWAMQLQSPASNWDEKKKVRARDFHHLLFLHDIRNICNIWVKTKEFSNFATVDASEVLLNIRLSSLAVFSEYLQYPQYLQYTQYLGENHRSSEVLAKAGCFLISDWMISIWPDGWWARNYLQYFQ